MLQVQRKLSYFLSLKINAFVRGEAMELLPLPRLFIRNIANRNPLVLLGGVLLYIAPAIASAQNVTFAGAQSNLPFNGLSSPTGLARDNAGDVFVSYDTRVVELPRTAIGYGAQTTLPFSGLAD